MLTSMLRLESALRGSSYMAGRDAVHRDVREGLQLVLPGTSDEAHVAVWCVLTSVLTAL
jgi:hypothetical protein